jgi:triosephosphate isomerase
MELAAEPMEAISEQMEAQSRVVEEVSATVERELRKLIDEAVARKLEMPAPAGVAAR